MTKVKPKENSKVNPNPGTLKPKQNSKLHPKPQTLKTVFPLIPRASMTKVKLNPQRQTFKSSPVTLNPERYILHSKRWSCK